MRLTLGESLASIESFSTPILEATTSSLEALEAYSRATRLNRSGQYQSAIPHVEHAIELDPEFASAHRLLGTLYSNTRELDAAARQKARAYELRERASRSERLHI